MCNYLKLTFLGQNSQVVMSAWGTLDSWPEAESWLQARPSVISTPPSLENNMANSMLKCRGDAWVFNDRKSINPSLLKQQVSETVAGVWQYWDNREVLWRRWRRISLRHRLAPATLSDRCLPRPRRHTTSSHRFLLHSSCEGGGA